MENSLQFAMALLKNGVPFDLHIFQHGDHGGGLSAPFPGDEQRLHPWARDLLFWLKLQKFID